MVDYGKTYLLRIINAVMNEEMFLKVAHHKLKVVGLDGAYIKPIKTNYILITPGQTMDVLLTADQSSNSYYMAARAFAGITYDNTTTTAIVQYNGNYTSPATPSFPNLPDYNDTNAVTNFIKKFKALANKDYPIDVPKTIDTHLTITISMNTLPCVYSNTSLCEGPNNTMLSASLNNISFVQPDMDILQAYYRKIGGVFMPNFPMEPSYVFNYTADEMPDNVLNPKKGTKARILKYNSTVEIVLQGTNVLQSAEDHPVHLHGYSFYLVGRGSGNFNNKTDPKGYNLVDPPEVNMVGVPKKGWAAIRFRADNPGVWFMHCHLERHSSWGMATVLIVENGGTRLTSMKRPPRQLNPC